MLTDIEKVEIRMAMKTLKPPFFVDQQQVWGCIIPLLDEIDALKDEVVRLSHELIEETLLNTVWGRKYDTLSAKIQAHPEWLAQLLMDSSKETK